MINSREHTFLGILFSENAVLKNIYDESSLEKMNAFITNYFLTLSSISLTEQEYSIFNSNFSNLESEFLEFLTDNQKQNLQSDIYNLLIENNNVYLLRKIDEQNLLILALKKTVREDLKNKFKSLDDQQNEFLTEKDLKVAFSVIARQNMKDKMIELDKKSSESKKIMVFLKYAAILVLMILPAYLTITWNSHDKQFAKHKNKSDKLLQKDTIDTQDTNYFLNETNYNLNPEEIQIAESKLLKEMSFGIANVDESIKFKISFISTEKCEEIVFKMSKQIERYKIDLSSGTRGKGPKSSFIEKEITKLEKNKKLMLEKIEKHSNSYLYDIDEDRFEFYINQNFQSYQKNDFTFLKIDNNSTNNGVYLKVKGNYFKLTKTKKLNRLSRIIDADLVETLNLLED
jgi:hypothetical protein